MRFKLQERYYDEDELMAYVDKREAIKEYIDEHYTDEDIFKAWRDEWYPKHHTVDDEDYFAEFGGVNNVTEEDMGAFDISSMKDDLDEIGYFDDIKEDAIQAYYNEYYDDLVDAFEWDNDPYGARGLRQSDFF